MDCDSSLLCNFIFQERSRCFIQTEQLSCPASSREPDETITATLVCEELGFSYIEMNASDTRNKKTHINQSLSNQKMDGFLPGKSACPFIFVV